jgi:hypothetical protein
MEMTMGINSTSLNRRQIPLWLKLAYTAFVAVVIPVYWVNWTPVNFLYFCDVALLMTLPALWLENCFLVSMMALSITLPQLAWQVDFIVYPLTGRHFPIDLAGYMFDPTEPLFNRGLSFFHFWLPILLVWLVWRFGYDRRASWAQVGLCWLVLGLSYVFTTYPTGPAGNVNKVLGPGGDKDPPQVWMHPVLWLGLLMATFPVVIYLPTHLIFRWTMPERRCKTGGPAALWDAGGKFISSGSGEPEERTKVGEGPVIAGEQKQGLVRPEDG